MSFIALIPAKGTSTAINKKNLQKIGDNSLLDWSLKFAVEQQSLSKIIVSTECASIVQNCSILQEGIKDFQEATLDELIPVTRRLFVHKRHPVQASSIAKTTDLLEGIFRNSSFSDNDVIVTLQPTTPFRSKTEYDEIVDFVSSQESLESLFTAVVFDSPHPDKAILLDSSGGIDLLRTQLSNLDKPRQELDSYFVSDGHYYFTRVSQIRRVRKLITESSRVWVRNPRYQVNIDTMNDLDFARYIFETRREELNWFPT
jgi:CMP-N-acetylneuraminic acid synthetase